MAKFTQENSNNDCSNKSLANSSDEFIVNDKRTLIPIRYIIIALCSFSTFLMFYLRLNLSVAIVAMVKHDENSINNDANVTDSTMTLSKDDDRCPAKDEETYENAVANGVFEWNEEIQGIILGAYFYGYAPCQIIGGRISERWGSKWTIFIGVAASIICTFLTPIAAEFGVTYIVVVRVIMGVLNAFIFCAIYTLYSKWIPKSERATALAAMVTGSHVGSVVTAFASAMLCELDSGKGWRFAFYIPGGVSLIWIVLWVIFATDSAADNKFISRKELEYIQQNIDITQKRIKNVPWKSICTSMGIWATIAAKCGATFSYITLSSKLPSYLESVLRVDMTNNGMINALMYVGLSIGGPLGGPLSDYLRRKQIFSLTVIRKFFQTLSSIGPIISLTVVPFVGCDDVAVSALLIFSMSTCGFATGGDVPIFADMAPSYSGTVFGVANTFSSCVGFIAPLIVGVILGEHGSRKSWNIVFYISAAINVIGVIFFDIFATAELQPWGVAKDTETSDKDNDSKKSSQCEKNGDITIDINDSNVYKI